MTEKWSKNIKLWHEICFPYIPPRALAQLRYLLVSLHSISFMWIPSTILLVIPSAAPPGVGQPGRPGCAHKTDLN